MHLTCPSCDSRFLVANEQLRPASRRVRCGRCGHEWHAKTARGATLKINRAPKTGRAPKTEDAVPTARLEVSDEARRRARDARRPPPARKGSRGRGGAVGWVLFVAVVLGLVAGSVFYRQQVVAWVPATTDLYTLVGLPVGPGVKIRDHTTDVRLVDGE